MPTRPAKVLSELSDAGGRELQRFDSVVALPTIPSVGRHATLWMMIGLAALSLGVRLPWLGRVGYQPDEIWMAEIATARGSAHQRLPRNQFIPPPAIYDLHTAPPWWQVWTHMECTHPPLDFLLLRLWMDLFGTGDATERLLSVLDSTAAVLLLFDTVRRLNGPWVAVWAGVLMAVAEPQVDHARLTRNYALLMATTLATANLLVRVEQNGGNRRRYLGLLLATVATLLTHYFCVGALAGMSSYAAIRMRGSTRRNTLLAFAAAGVIFVIVWGPFMWQQRHLFSTNDEATLFLNEHDPAHVMRSLQRFVLVPAGMLAGPRAGLLGMPALLGAIYFSPLRSVWRRSGMFFWMIWLWAVPGALLLMDLTRQTSHLNFIRYTLLSGPAVYALIPAIAATLPGIWFRHILPLSATTACLFALPEVFHNPVVLDPHVIVDQLQPPLTSEDRLVFSATPELEWVAGENYLMMSRYAGPLPCRVAILDHPPEPLLLQEARSARRLIVLSHSAEEDLFWPWPGMTLLQPPRFYRGRGILSIWSVGSKTLPFHTR